MLFFSTNVFSKNVFGKTHWQRSFAPLIWALAMAVATFGLAACQPQGQGGGQQAAVDTAQVLATFDSLRSAYEEAYAAGNMEAVSALPHPKAMYSPPGHPPIQSRDSILAYESRSRPPGATIDLRPTDTRILSSEWVYEFGTATVTFTPEGADSSRSAESTYLAIFRKTPEGWKTYREVISTNAPPQ